MTDEIDHWILLLVMSGITIFLRAVPLLITRSFFRTRWMINLNQELPLCVMIILVVHSLAPSDINPNLLGELIALVLVAVSYLRWRNALLSVVLGLGMLALFPTLTAHLREIFLACCVV